jgi:hypothetical protein
MPTALWVIAAEITIQLKSPAKEIWPGFLIESLFQLR